MNNLAQDLEPPVPPEEIAAAEEAHPVEQPGEKPEAKPEAKEPEAEKLVRLEALHEERGKRKELAKQLEQEKRERAQFQAVMTDRINQLYAVQQPKPEGPSYEVDPLANLKQGQELTQQQLAHMAQRLQHEDAVRQHQAAQAGLISWARDQVAEFSKEKPDAMDAYRHIVGIRTQELKALGYSGQQLQTMIANDEMLVYQNAYQSGRNPAEIIYELAKLNGFTGKKDAKAEDKILTLQKGAEAAKGLGNGGGTSTKPTPEQIAAMSDDEFAEFKAKLPKGKRVSDVL